MAKRKRAADDKTTDEWRGEEQEDHDGTTITTTCHGGEEGGQEASGGEEGAEHTQPQTRHQQTAARKRQRTAAATTTSSSSSGEEHHQDPIMMDSSGPGLSTGKQLLTTKRRRRGVSPFGTSVAIDGGGGGATHGQFVSAEDLNQVDDEIDVDHQQQPAHHHMHHHMHHHHQHHQQQEDGDEAEEAMTTGRAKNKHSSAAEAGLISPMRAFADAEAAAAAAAAAGGPLGSFVVLPVEIMLHLLSFLSGKDVGHIRLTSSEFNRYLTLLRAGQPKQREDADDDDNLQSANAVMWVRRADWERTRRCGGRSACASSRPSPTASSKNPSGRRGSGCTEAKRYGHSVPVVLSPPNAQEWPHVAHPRLVCGFSREKVVHNSKDSIKDGEVCCYRTKECRCTVLSIIYYLLFIMKILFTIYCCILYLFCIYFTLKVRGRVEGERAGRVWDRALVGRRGVRRVEHAGQTQRLRPGLVHLRYADSPTPGHSKALPPYRCWLIVLVVVVVSWGDQATHT